MRSTYDVCTASNDVYSEVCNELTRLCPRLVPRPLRRLNLTRIVTMAPQVALAICDTCLEVMEELHHYLVGLGRSGRCEVCGEPGNKIDEDWLYCVLDEDNKLVRKGVTTGNFTAQEARRYKGIARLQSLRLLCERCYLAKHQGYALVRRKGQEVLRHLSRINELTPERTKKLVRKAFFTYCALSEICDWTIEIGELKELDEGIKKGLEELLNTMYRRGFYLLGKWLYYKCPRYRKDVEFRTARETLDILAEASRKSGTTNIASDKWIESLLETIKEGLEPKGVQVLNHEFRLFIKYLLGNEERRKHLQEIVNHISEDEADHHKSNALLLSHTGLTGKWMVFVHTNFCPKVFRYILDALEKAKLAWHAKIPSQREEYNSREELPIIIYVPMAFATRYVVEVAEVMRSVLSEFYIDRKIFFKPDLFTVKGIYSGKASHKSYIYIY